MSQRRAELRPSTAELDLSDVDHRVGKPVGGGQLWDPCSSSDIRRWVMAMDYPNPLHWDEEFAARLEVRRHRRAAVHRGGPGLRARRAARLRRPYSGQPPDLRRRGMVVLRLSRAARRQAVPGAPLPRLQGDRDEIRRARPCSPAATPSTPTSTAPWWRASARPRSAICSTRRPSAACSTSQLGEIKRWTQNELERDRAAAPRVARCPTDWASRRASTR